MSGPRSNISSDDILAASDESTPPDRLRELFDRAIAALRSGDADEGRPAWERLDASRFLPELHLSGVLLRNKALPPDAFAMLLEQVPTSSIDAMAYTSTELPPARQARLAARSESVRRILVNQEKLDQAVIDELARHRTMWGLLLDRGDVPDALWSRLLDDREPSFHAQMVRHDNTPIEHLRRLATCDEDSVRSALARSERLPADVALVLVHDPELSVRIDLAQNERCPPDVLALLAEDKEPAVRKFVAANPACPARTRRRLKVPSLRVIGWRARWAAVSSGAISGDRLLALRSDPHYLVRGAVAERPELTPTELAEFVDTLYHEARNELARDEETAPEVLTVLAGDRSDNIRGDVARNPSTPAAALDRLADDLNPDVVGSVAENPHTPAGTLQRLADENEAVALAALRNPSVPPALLDLVTRADPRNASFAIAAANPSLSRPTIERLLNSTDASRRVGALRNPALLPADLDDGCADEDIAVRMSAAANPSIGRAQIERLLRDDDLAVRSSVVANPSFPKELLELIVDDDSPMMRLNVVNLAPPGSDYLERMVHDAEVFVRRTLAGREDLTESAYLALAGDADASVRSAVAANRAVAETVRALAVLG